MYFFLIKRVQSERWYHESKLTLLNTIHSTHMAYASLDIETTGFDPEQDSPIEVAVVIFDTNGVRETFSTLLNPHCDIPPIVTHITGITQDDVAQAPLLQDVTQNIVDIVGAHTIVGHNVNFDLTFLAHKGIVLDNPVIDTMDMTRILYPSLPSYSLETISSILAIADKQTHRALDDAHACHKLLQRLHEKIQSLDPTIVQTLANVFTPCAPHIAAFFSGGTPGGVFHDETTTVRHRKSLAARGAQKQIQKEIETALNEKQSLILEAGIGNNKYMALAHALAQWYKAGEGRTGAGRDFQRFSKKTLISVATPGLQEHLCTHILPEIANDLPIAMIKEANRYLSPRRLSDFMSNENRTLGDCLFAAKIYLWSTHTKTGEIDEISLTNEESPAWGNINVNEWHCDTTKEPWIQKAHEEQKKATIIVCYHRALLGIAREHAPVHQSAANLIVCEAQQFEKHILEARSHTYSQEWIEQRCELPEAIKHKLTLFFGLIGIIYERYTGPTEQSLLINPSHKNTPEWLRARDSYDNLMELLTKPPVTPYMAEVRDELAQLANVFHETNESATLQIYQNQQQRMRARLIPLETLQPLWRSPLCESLNTTIFIGDTLRINKSFKYLQERLAFPATLTEVAINSNPEIINNLEIIIPSTLPDPDQETYESSMHALIETIITKTPGQTITLFSSKRSVHNIYYALAEKLKTNGISVISQDFSGGKGKIAEKYRIDPEHGAIMGTISFLERMDLRRLPCVNLIFQKIPFDPPTDPVQQIQTYRYADPFKAYALPETILRILNVVNQCLKSEPAGPKRLYILDARITRKSYGKELLNSFPEGCTITI